jgi:hypothetical protein
VVVQHMRNISAAVSMTGPVLGRCQRPREPAATKEEFGHLSLCGEKQLVRGSRDADQRLKRLKLAVCNAHVQSLEREVYAKLSRFSRCGVHEPLLTCRFTGTCLERLNPCLVADGSVAARLLQRPERPERPNFGQAASAGHEKPAGPSRCP